jgi:hypothetical protein
MSATGVGTSELNKPNDSKHGQTLAQSKSLVALQESTNWPIRPPLVTPFGGVGAR